MSLHSLENKEPCLSLPYRLERTSSPAGPWEGSPHHPGPLLFPLCLPSRALGGLSPILTSSAGILLPHHALITMNSPAHPLTRHELGLSLAASSHLTTLENRPLSPVNELPKGHPDPSHHYLWTPGGAFQRLPAPPQFASPPPVVLSAVAGTIQSIGMAHEPCSVPLPTSTPRIPAHHVAKYAQLLPGCHGLCA